METPKDISVWIEKYRPTKLDNIVLDEINRDIFRNIIQDNYFPHLLFYGPPGTGKTSSVINLVNEYQQKYSTSIDTATSSNGASNMNKSQIIHLNASDERGIDIIRNQIYQFVQSNNLFDNGLKFVILDEVDYMTKNAQQALKYLLQTTSYNVRFCLICNYISKIDESLRNEFICIRFNQLPKNDIFQFIKSIAIKENVMMDDEAIEIIQSLYNSDIRSMINFIQLNKQMDFRLWKENIIHQQIYENILAFVRKEKTTENYGEFINYIHNVSNQYNIDKKTILQSYCNFLLRKYTEKITTKLLNDISVITHNTQVSVQYLLNYFYWNF